MWTGGELLTAVAQAKPYDCITEKDMVRLTKLGAAAVAESCAKLVAARLLRRTDKGCYQLTAAGRAAAAQAQTGVRNRGRSELRERIWHALRNSDKPALSIPDLIERVAQGGERNIEPQIGMYLNALGRAGYVMQMPIRGRSMMTRGRGFVRWRLVRDTGTAAPVWWRARGIVYDPNTLQEIRLAADFKRAGLSAGREGAAP